MVAFREIRLQPLLVFLAVYLAASLFSLFGPEQMLRNMQLFAWLLGPPASLVYGRQYLWAVASGTIFTIIPLLWVMIGRTVLSYWLGAVLTAMAWSLSGLMVYAPGA